MVMAGFDNPAASMMLSIADTVPETELCMLAETKPEACAINCPVFTLSPF